MCCAQSLSHIQLSGECVISSVLSCCSKDLKWWTSDTALLQLRVLFNKQRKLHPQGMRVGQPQRRGVNPSWLPPFIHLSPSPTLSLPYANWASQEGCLFHLRFSLWSLDFLLFHFRRLFPFFVFQPLPLSTPFPYSNYLTT